MPSYAQKLCMDCLSDVPVLVIIIMILCDCNAIFKIDTLNDFGTMITTAESDPSFAGRLHELEDHHNGSFT